MAITAWSAKFVTRSICLSVNGRTSWRKITKAPINSFSRSIGTARIVRAPATLTGHNPPRVLVGIVAIREHIYNVDGLLGAGDLTEDGILAPDSGLTSEVGKCWGRTEVRPQVKRLAV